MGLANRILRLRHWKVLASALLLSTVLVGPHLDAASDRAINRAIDRGIKYLIGQIKEKQVAEPNWKGVGTVALETYALVVSGVSVKDPLIVKNFEYLHKHAIGKSKKQAKTYVVACYVFALDAAIAQVEHDVLILRPKKQRELLIDDPRIGKEYRPHLARAIEAMVYLQNEAGSWRYGAGKDFDNSNVQFAVLALGVGAKRHIPIDRSVWLGVVNHFLKWQQDEGRDIKARLELTGETRERHRLRIVSENKRHIKQKKSRKKKRKKKKDDGKTVVKKVDKQAKPLAPDIGTETMELKARGWAYAAEKKGYNWNMTCAGLSSMLLARRNLQGLPPDLNEALNKAIWDGYGWLMASWSPTKSYYGIYSLEKVADIGGVFKFNGKDWYEQVSNHLVGQQKEDGSWKGGGHETSRVATAFSLLILVRATSLLTKNPASLIVISGKDSSKGGVGDRSWVYVPELNATMHYPTLMRTVQLRPDYRLIKFLKNIVDNYSVEWKGELIPDMARVRDGIRNRAARKIIDGYLVDITGVRYKNWEKYLVWHRRWERVMMIGQKKSKKNVPDLLTYYESTQKSFVLRKSITWALIQCKARDAIPLFLADLDHKDKEVRREAYNAFRAFFIDLPPRFDYSAKDKTRRAQIEEIKTWYARQRAS